LEHAVTELSENLSLLFAGLIECRDENTGHHVLRTSYYVSILGQKLIEKKVFADLTADSVKMMMRAAPLHDIGKIAISDSVLLKPGRLDDDEFNAMKMHSAVGASIIDKMYARTPNQRYLYYAKDIAAFHHERYDGKGYPAGLMRDDIPLCARIMAVADVYDALVDNRVYRKAMSHEQACSIIIEGKGTQFDPDIVSIFELCEQAIAKLRQQPGGDFSGQIF
jgi:putative two-component system response regulator